MEIELRLNVEREWLLRRWQVLRVPMNRCFPQAKSNPTKFPPSFDRFVVNGPFWTRSLVDHRLNLRHESTPAYDPVNVYATRPNSRKQNCIDRTTVFDNSRDGVVSCDF